MSNAVNECKTVHPYVATQVTITPIFKFVFRLGTLLKVFVNTKLNKPTIEI